jgi:BirA family biotin operon repressor/biotin-[acetyl-CoA-carboxylase] ligase
MNDAAARTLAGLNAAAEHIWPPMQAMLEAHIEHASPPRPACGLTVEVLASIASTNTELMRRARAGHNDPVLLVTVDQTAGRGRMGKTWVSQPGDSLTFSLGLPLQPANWAGLSLAVGVSLADALATHLPAHLRPQLQLKWPNDLWLGGAKLAGILVETAHAGSHPHVVVGVGINITPPAATWPPAATLAATPAPGAAATTTTTTTAATAAAAWPGVPPTGLADCAPQLDAASVLKAVAPALLNDVLAFEVLGFSAFAQRFALRDALRNQPVVLSDGTQGTGCGVDDSGALLVLTTDGMRTIHSSEVSVRPKGMAPC